MRSLRWIARTYVVAASTAMREKTAYFGNFVGSMFTYALFVFIFSRVWAGAYSGATEIAGYTMTMAVWYFIVAEVPSFGFGRFFRTLSNDMKSGQVAYLLARPYDYVGYNCAEKLGGSLVEAGIILLEGLVVGLLLVGLPPSIPGTVPVAAGLELARLSSLVLSLLLAGALNYYLQISIAMTAFWFEENDAFFWIFQKFALIIGTLIPIEFLPSKVARIAVWTPFPYISYAPARIAVAFSLPEALSLMGRQVLWVLLAMLVARSVFQAGSRRLSVNGG